MKTLFHDLLIAIKWSVEQRNKTPMSSRQTLACRRRLPPSLEMAELVPPDLLSNLPLGIIHDILGRLPIREAARTSILSSHWRYNWTALPNLLFNEEAVYMEDPCYYGVDFPETNANAIDSVFRQHKGPIHRFEMSYESSFTVKFLEEWLLFLARNDIRELIINVGWSNVNDSHSLESSIYTCTKLTKLDLWNISSMKPPPLGFKGFLLLTSLSLDRVCIQAVEILLANSPLLERLTILEMVDHNPVRLTVNAPNLKYMELGDDYQEIELCLYAPLLAVMHVNFKDGDFQLGVQSLGSNYVSFFRCFSNLVQLYGSNFFIRYLSIGIQSCHLTLELHHLEVIVFSEVNFADTKETMVVGRLIIGAPNLHTLYISPSARVVQSGASFKDFGFAPNFTFKKLKVASMCNICDYLFGRQFIKFLLESSPALETLYLAHVDKQVSAELLGFRRASTNARILATVS